MFAQRVLNVFCVKLVLTVAIFAQGGEQSSPPSWYDSTAGLSTAVLPPWEPLQVTESAGEINVSCWNRSYQFSGSPFPSQIRSAGENLLSSPITVRLIADDSTAIWQTKSSETLQQSPERVEFSFNIESELVTLTGNAAIEFDGMVKVDCTFTPHRELNVEYLRIEIPVKEEHALFFNSPWATRFANPLDETGAVDQQGWQWQHTFVPSISLRDDERGLDWACESDEGWRPYDRPDTLTVSHQNGSVIISLNILEGVRLAKPLTISMVFEATPVRPLHPQSRILNIVHFQGGPDADGQQWNIEGFGTTSYPLRGLQKAAEFGANTLIFHELWAAGFGRPVPYDSSEFLQAVEAAHAAKMKVLVYYGACLWAQSPEYLAHAANWNVVPYESPQNAATKRSDMQYIGVCPRGTQYLNFLAAGLQDLVEQFNVDGIYIDGGEPFPCQNRAHGCGYVDEETGKVRPTWNLFPSRELRRRLYTILKEQSRPTLVEQHLPYGQTAAVHAFCDTYLAGEPLAHAITEDYIIPQSWLRRELTGVQFGAPAEILCYKDKFLNKYLAAALLHGAQVRLQTSDYVYLPESQMWQGIAPVRKVFADFGVADAEWRPYWVNQGELRIQPDSARVSYYRKTNRDLLLIITNPTPVPMQIDFRLDPATLQLVGPELLVIDPFEHRKYEIQHDELSIKLDADAFKLIQIN